MKKKVLFINGHLNVGGVEKSLVDILKNIDLNKIDLELLLLEEIGDYATEIPEQVNIRMVDLHNTYGSVFGSIKRCIKDCDWKSLKLRIIFLLTKYLGKEKLYLAEKIFGEGKEYDCVVGFRPGIVTELAAYAINGKKKITWWHHGEFNLNPIQAKEYGNICKKMDQIVSVSNGCKEFLIKYYPEIEEKITVIPNMLNLSEIEQKSKMYIPYKKEEGVYDLVSVGRLAPEKHFENIIYAAKRMIENGIMNFRWFIVGDGEEKSLLRKNILEYELKDYVFLVGSKKNPYPYMKYADLFVHTSYVESQCLVALEAMSLGKVCVLTESIGIKEFAVNGKNCILAEATAKSLWNNIIGIIQGGFESDIMSAEARKTAESFSAEHIIIEIQNILK